MEYTRELEKSLTELKKITGLSLDVHATTTEEMEQASEQIRLLCSAYRNKYDRGFFLQELLQGHIEPQEIHELTSRFHIERTEPRVLFLLESATPMDEFTMEILKNLFPSRTGTYLVSTGLTTTAVLQPLKKKAAADSIRSVAYTLLDTLGTEALISVKVAFSKVLTSLDDLPQAYQSCCTALRIGKIFNSEQNVYPCDKLGIGQLICQLPIPPCENFLREIFGEHIPDKLDDELIHAVNAFFKNNLNIAETARQLHMHRNTFIYRLEQIQKNTGLDLRIFEDAIVYKIASMVISYLQTVERST